MGYLSKVISPSWTWAIVHLPLVIVYYFCHITLGEIGGWIYLIVMDYSAVMVVVTIHSKTKAPWVSIRMFLCVLYLYVLSIGLVASIMLAIWSIPYEGWAGNRLFRIISETIIVAYLVLVLIKLGFRYGKANVKHLE